MIVWLFPTSIAYGSLTIYSWRKIFRGTSWNYDSRKAKRRAGSDIAWGMTCATITCLVAPPIVMGAKIVHTINGQAKRHRIDTERVARFLGGETPEERKKRKERALC